MANMTKGQQGTLAGRFERVTGKALRPLGTDAQPSLWDKQARPTFPVPAQSTKKGSDSKAMPVVDQEKQEPLC